MMNRLLTCTLLAATIFEAPVTGFASEFDGPNHKADAQGRHAIALFHLYREGSAQCGSAKSFEGRVVKREFAENGTTMSNIVIENRNGEREVINVYISSDDWLDHYQGGLAEYGWVAQGLQTIARVGRIVHGTARLCGAAGRVEVVDSISAR
jgi:hypothetical protein